MHRLPRSLLLALVGSAGSIAPLASAQEPPTPPSPAAGPKAVVVAITPLAHVEQRGRGPVAIVLIPGFTCDWSVYQTFMDRNADKYTMYAVTLPGFGGSQAPRAEPAGEHGGWMDNAAAAVWQMIESRKLDRPVVVGHSMGGMLAMKIAAEHPGKLRAAVSIDGMPAYPVSSGDVTPEQRRNTIKAGMEPQMTSLTDEQWKANQAQFVLPMVTDPKRGQELVKMCAVVPKDTAVAYMLDLMSVDYRPLLPKIDCPMLLIAAETKDGPYAALVEKTRRIWSSAKAQLPKGSLATFYETRHFVMDDRPAEFDVAIATFLDGKPVADVGPKPGAAAPAGPEKATPPGGG